MLSSGQLERWAAALLALGDLEGARSRLAELEDLAAGASAGLEVRRARNRVLRGVVELTLRQRELPVESLMQLLAAYRGERLLVPADELWAIGRQAELRLETGDAQKAIDHLLVDMRRFEPRLSESQLSFSELLTLLGRAYYDLGNYRHAGYHVERALEQIDRSDPDRGDGLALLGQIAVAKGEWHDAFELFDEVVRNYSSTRSGLPGRLGRAEVHSVLGEHERSLADYRKLGDLLEKAGPRRDVTKGRVARSLLDRHDAALTEGRLDVALRNVILAESFYEPARVEADMLFRVASTSRQLADNKMAESFPRPPPEVDPQLRHEASVHYRRAADYYVRHARLLAASPDEDGLWADSLWLAADSYDLGGWPNLAILHFDEYLAGRSEADPRRPDVVFRLAQAHHAELDYEAAAGYYEQVIDEHPRSHLASQSHVPLARCYFALERRPEAERQLVQVLDGKRYLKPDAVDYRDALVELGTSYYEGEDYVKAIERLDEAVRRYSDDPRIDAIRFRLGDSYRHRAAEAAQGLAAPAVPPGERHRLESMRADHLRTAMQLFGEVCDGGGASSSRVLRDACHLRADCVYELEMYAEAVGLYDEMAARFPRHHSSMTALIQIVNCYSKLGDLERARTAHRRALVKLKELSDEAFNAPDALLDRDAWERWLENMPLGEPATASASS